MIEITEKLRYFIPGGLSFATEEKATAHLEDRLRAAFDRMVLSTAVLHPGDRIKLSDAFIAHRDELAAMCWETTK